MMTGTTETQVMGGAGYGAGMGIGGLGLVGLVGLNNLWGNQNVQSDTLLGARLTDMQIAGVNSNITNSNYASTQQLQAGQNALQASLAGDTQSILAGQASVKDSVQNLGYENAILTLQATHGINSNIAELSFAGQAQTCQLDRAISESTSAIIANQNAIAMQNLRDELMDTKLNYALDQRGLLTATGPNMAVVQPNLCQGRDITIINENINAIGSKVDTAMSAVSQLAGIVSTLNTSK